VPDQPPFWSVVIPLYNKGPYIEATVASVLAQSDPDFEIVVVDDGSRDEGPDRVAAMSDPRIRLIRQANGGVSAARNRGISECRGEFIAFLDGDDLYHPEFLAVLKIVLARNPGSRVVAGGYERVLHEHMAQHVFDSLEIPSSDTLIRDLPAHFLRKGLPFFTSSIAVNRAWLLGMDEHFPVGESMGEDLDLWFRLAEKGPIVWVDVPVAVYRIGVADSLMGAYQGVELLPVWRRLEMRAIDAAYRSDRRSSALRLVADARITLARVLISKQQRFAALSCWIKAWRGMAGHRWWFTILFFVSTRLARLIR